MDTGGEPGGIRLLATLTQEVTNKNGSDAEFCFESTTTSAWLNVCHRL
jgi:hypothetical protein